MKHTSIKKSAVVFAALIGLFIISTPATNWAVTAEQMRSYIVQQFEIDPRIDASNLRVERQGNMFVVSGTVKSLGEQRVVMRVLDELVGDKNLILRIKVVPSGSDDEKIEETIRALMPQYCLARISDFSVTSHNGNVVLRGTTDNLHHSMSAEYAAEQIRGIKSIDNKIKVTSGRYSNSSIHDTILATARPYLERYDIKDFKITVKNGVVTIYGKTTSHELKNKLVEIAQMVDGVTKVNNMMRSYSPAFDTVHDR